MTMNRRTTGTGVAVLLAGALLGWGASTMSNSARFSQASPGADLPIASVEQKDQPSGDITPRESYRAPAETRSAPRATHRTVRRTSTGITVPAGTPLSIEVATNVSSKTSSAGDSWYGHVTQDVYRNGRLVIPAGSPVRGTVRVARSAERGDRAQLQLGLSSVTVHGRSYAVTGHSQLITAGSPRARNVGAIAGGTAAGALLGKAIGGSTKSTVIGAVVGGSAATAAVAASKGYQAKIASGTEVSFTTSRSISVRRA
jgi:hypothetical protein